MTSADPQKIRVGDALVDEGAITPEQLEHALSEQKSSGMMIGELLIQQGVISSTTLSRTLAKCLGVKGCQLRHGLIDGALLKLIGEEEAERMRIIPMFKVHDTHPFCFLFARAA